MILTVALKHKNYIFTFLNPGANFSAIKFSNFSLSWLEFVKTISLNPNQYISSFFIPSSSFGITSNIFYNVSSPTTLPFSSTILGSCIFYFKAFVIAPPQNIIDWNNFSLSHHMMHK